ncbi:MAG TPA: ABC transporter permease [Rudaea sp.]|nr:ABC transporter permease [Rudaea sp.]
MESFLRDIAHGFRRLLAQPGSSLIIVLTLTFGIGASTAIFSLIDGVLFRSLPFRDGSRIVEISQGAPKLGVENMGASAADVQDYREQNSTLDQVVEYHDMYFLIAGKSPALVRTAVVSANYFDFLGVAPVLGRGFVADDDKTGAEPVIVLTHDFWINYFHGDKDVVGKTVEMNDKANRIVGVLPPIPQFPAVSDIYMPTMGCPMRSDPNFVANRGSRMMSMYGRMKPGVTLAQAAGDIDLVARHLQSSYPAVYPKGADFVTKVVSVQDELTRGIRSSLYLLFAASLLVLLITCANVVNLTLAQQSRRQKELAVRAALGADRLSLARTLLVESMMLAIAGGLGGLLLAYASMDLLTSFAAMFTTRAGEVAIDGRVLAFNAIVSMLAGLAVGLAPLFGKHDILNALKEGGAHATLSRQRHAVRKLLIVAQVAIAFMLVVGAGLMIRSFLALQATDPGFKPDGVVAVTTPLNWSKYDDEASVRNFVGTLRSALADTEGIDDVALATGYPFGNGVGISLGNALVTFEDRAADAGGAQRTNFQTVTGDYFKLLGIPLVSGRYLSDGDDEKATPVAVLSRAMAEKFWPNESPLNRRFSPDNGKTWLTVVGVVGDVKGAGFDKPVISEYYVSYAQFPSQTLNVLVKTHADFSHARALVERVIARLDPGQPISKATTLTKAMADTLSSPRLLSQVLGLFSLIALLISIVGVSGLLAFTVSQRTKEMGIRMALGAEPEAVRQMVLRQGLALVATGLGIGVVGSFALGRLMSSLLYGTSPMDAATFSVVIALFFAASIAACWMPAARASRLDPNAALRTT